MTVKRSNQGKSSAPEEQTPRGDALSLQAELSAKFGTEPTNVENSLHNDHSERMGEQRSWEDELRIIVARHVNDEAAASELISDLAQAFSKRAAGLSSADKIVHQESGLIFPPSAGLPWVDRHLKYSTRIAPEDFLKAEYGEYTKRTLFYAEHMRRDSALDTALRRRAASLGIAVDDFLLANGVLTKKYTLSPPEGFEPQAAFLRSVWLRTYSDAVERTLRQPRNKAS